MNEKNKKNFYIDSYTTVKLGIVAEKHNTPRHATVFTKKLH